MSKPSSKDIWVDPYTFGGSPACKVLAEMLNENLVSIKEKHKILSFINDVIMQFRSISEIENNSCRVRLMILVRDHFFNKIEGMPYPKIVNSHLKTVVVHHFRRILKLKKSNLDNRNAS
jgi:hypothetical protein